MNMRHIAVLALAAALGMVFSGTLRQLPLLSSLPQR